MSRIVGSNEPSTRNVTEARRTSSAPRPPRDRAANPCGTRTERREAARLKIPAPDGCTCPYHRGE